MADALADALAAAGTRTDQKSHIVHADIPECSGTSAQTAVPDPSEPISTQPVHREIAVDGMKSPFYVQGGSFPLLMNRLVGGQPQPEPEPNPNTVLVTTDSAENLTWGPDIKLDADKTVKAIADKIGTIPDNQAAIQGDSTNTSSAPAPPAPRLVRTNSNRPPPPTPPETVVQDQLSMPTLPALHHNSVPQLVETYCSQRATNPEEFDRRTQAIKAQLILAKVERGGSDQLLRNEYTAELASRLDAEIVQCWSEVRQHEQNEYVESEGGDQDHDTLMEEMLDKNQHANAVGQAQADDNVEVGEIAGHFDEASILRELRELNIPDHVVKLTTSGNIRFQSQEIRRITDTGEKRTFKTWIEVTQDVEVMGEQNSDMKQILDAIRASSERENKAIESRQDPNIVAIGRVAVVAENEPEDSSVKPTVPSDTEVPSSCDGECAHCTTCTDRISSMRQYKSKVDAVLRAARARQDHVDARLEFIQQQLNSTLTKNSLADPVSGTGVPQTAHVRSKYESFFKTKKVRATVPDKDQLFASLSDLLSLLYTGRKMGEAIEVVDTADNKHAN